MHQENGFTPQEAIVHAVVDTSEPWTKALLPPPHLTVLEVARITKLPQGAVVGAVLKNEGKSEIILEDSHGIRVNGNLMDAAIASAPGKRVAKEVQKNGSAFLDVAFRTGRDRLRLKLS